MTLGLTYETSNAKLKKAKEIIENILKSTNKIDLENYFISFDNFNASSLDIQLIYWITELEYIEYLKIRDSINTRIKDEFEKAKIEFAYPTQTIYVKK
jgi:MscS family membrane protein